MEITSWLKDSFSKKSIPDWTCPSCANGLLKLEQDQFHFKETQLSLGWHKEDAWEPEFIQYRFHGTLTCTTCSDFVSFLGKGGVDHIQYMDHRNEYHEEYNDVFYPLHFNPPLHIFQIRDGCPEGIKNEIIESFAHLWNDLPSCANKIRTSLEMLMNQQKVKKTFIARGKRNKLSLHKRIEAFKTSKPEIADFLLAIKWIGNEGSHTGTLEKIDVLEAYQLLEHSLNKLFDNKENELTKITKEINKRKGKRRR